MDIDKIILDIKNDLYSYIDNKIEIEMSKKKEKDNDDSFIQELNDLIKENINTIIDDYFILEKIKDKLLCCTRRK